MNELATREALERILSSRTFERSDRLRDFLSYILSKSADGRFDEISEQHIGHAVFHRDAGFDPSQDGIVRVTARQLRTKLAEYYSDEGRADAMVLEIPKGGYLPKWQPRATEPSSSAPAPNPWKRYCLFLAAALAIALASLGWVLMKDASPKSPASILLLSGGERVKVVVADSALTLYRTMAPPPFELPEYLERRWPKPDWLPEDPRAQRFWETLVNRKDTSFSAAVSVLLLAQTSPAAVSQIELRHPQTFHLRDLGGDNLLLLSGASALPWAQNFEKDLHFPHVGSNFQNPNPQPGEPALFLSEDRFGLRGKGFVRITVQPSGQSSARVVHIAGSSWLANELGTRYFTSPQSTSELDLKTGTAWRNQSNRIQLMLETQAIETAPSSVRLVAWRSLAQQ